MAYKAVTGTRTADIELDGSVYTVNFGCSYNYYAVRNDSAGSKVKEERQFLASCF